MKKLTKTAALTLTLALAAGSCTSAFAAGHTVKKGDNLYKITKTTRKHIPNTANQMICFFKLSYSLI